MAVSLITYLTWLPVGSSPGMLTVNNLESSSLDAASIIPCDNYPLNFTGLRFATSTTYFPTNSSGL